MTDVKEYRRRADELAAENAHLTNVNADLTRELVTLRAELAGERAFHELRSQAVNRTGESNERLRATIAAVCAATVEVERMAYDGQSAVRMIRTALADQEPARD